MKLVQLAPRPDAFEFCVRLPGASAVLGLFGALVFSRARVEFGASMASLNCGLDSPELDKKGKSPHRRFESLRSCAHRDVGAPQNLQPIEIRDEKGGQRTRIGIRGELSGFLPPYDRLPVGWSRT